ncbi:SCP-like extracellular protein [Alkaliphilus metalliredigens QYMF]|uniref:SCP-like extracellular protein n=1 Tax=Alkaliphilus metalliredigens (strain QYMF) TaxID=293826 RepID=A6TTI7_ALKMQ|nr:CAP domain-containing protein [Alkaliphilus metalliredigens]ABR49505.1 SCP-like extracellular protein [Alkaliphilus metalliredigens QYMF]
MRNKALLLLTFSLLLTTACGGPQDHLAQDNQPRETNLSAIFHIADVEFARVTADSADVKSGLGRDFDSLATLEKDSEIRVLNQSQDWYIVQLDNNQVGGIETADAMPIVREGADRREDHPTTPNETQQPMYQQQEELPQRQVDEDATQPGEEAPEEAPRLEEKPTLPPNERQQPQTGQQVDPEPQTTGIRALSAEEQQMFDLVNSERERNGLSTLRVDLEITRVARIKSQDMEDQNYFSHNSPTYGSPFDMLESFGVKYLHAGENLAGNASVEQAHTSLMNSAGHRRNILSPDFTHLGIGIVPSDRYGLLFTQVFISKPQ